MKSSEQLEREGEKTRACINQTLDELRSRVTPGQVLDEFVDYARDTQSGTLVRNLGQQVVENPLPLALIATGLAWLMASDARRRRTRATRVNRSDIGSAISQTADAARDFADSSRSTARDVAQTTRSAAQDLAKETRSRFAELRTGVRSTASCSADAASSALDGIHDAASRTADAAGSAIDNTRSAATSTYARVTRATRRATAAIGQSSTAFASSVQDRSLDFVDFCREQPLVVAGLGLALGAALGSALPVTEAEDRLLGDASDDVKERLQRVAGKMEESAKSAYEQVANEALATASSPPPTSSDAADTSAPRSVSSHDEGMAQPAASSVDPRMIRTGDERCECPSEGKGR